jgi:hypothetical protein
MRARPSSPKLRSLLRSLGLWGYYREVELALRTRSHSDPPSTRFVYSPRAARAVAFSASCWIRIHRSTVDSSS